MDRWTSWSSITWRVYPPFAIRQVRHHHFAVERLDGDVESGCGPPWPEHHIAGAAARPGCVQPRRQRRADSNVPFLNSVDIGAGIA